MVEEVASEVDSEVKESTELIAATAVVVVEEEEE